VASEVLEVPQEFSTIGAACSAAEPGDSVLVSPGNYSGPIVIDPGVVVKAVGSRDHTRIWAMTQGSRIEFSDVGVGEAVLEGFRVDHHSADTQFAIESRNSGTRISECHLYDWYPGADQGISVILRAGGVLERNLIGSGAYDAIYVEAGRVEIIENTFGGECHALPSTIVFLDTGVEEFEFVQNTCHYLGRSVLLFGPTSNGRIVNNLFGNIELSCAPGAILDIDYNLWDAPLLIDEDCGGELGTHNLIDVDPLLCDYPPCFDFSLHAESPCVGAGESGETLGAWPVGCGVVGVPTVTSSQPSLQVLSAPGSMPLRVLVPAGISSVALFDVAGRCVASRDVKGREGGELLWSPTVASGIYFLSAQELGGGVRVSIPR
jgi:hypothetical protein